MVTILSLLIHRLSDIIRTWDQLQEFEIGHFLYDGESRTSSAPLKASVAAVRKTFLELERVLRRLKDVENELLKDNERVSHLSSTGIGRNIYPRA